MDGDRSGASFGGGARPRPRPPRPSASTRPPSGWCARPALPLRLRSNRNRPRRCLPHGPTSENCFPSASGSVPRTPFLTGTPAAPAATRRSRRPAPLPPAEPSETDPCDASDQSQIRWDASRTGAERSPETRPDARAAPCPTAAAGRRRDPPLATSPLRGLNACPLQGHAGVLSRSPLTFHSPPVSYQRPGLKDPPSPSTAVTLDRLAVPSVPGSTADPPQGGVSRALTGVPYHRLSRPRARLFAWCERVCIHPFGNQEFNSQTPTIRPGDYSSSSTYIANAGIGGY